MLTQEYREIMDTLDTVNNLLYSLVVQGLKSADRDVLASLRSVKEEFLRIGSLHLTSKISILIDAIEQNSEEMAICFLEAQTSLRLFERVLTLQNAKDSFTTLTGEQ